MTDGAMADHGVVDELDSLTFEKLARRLPDELWQVFEPVLPPVIWCGNGRPPASNRACLHACGLVRVDQRDPLEAHAARVPVRQDGAQAPGPLAGT